MTAALTVMGAPVCKKLLASEVLGRLAVVVGGGPHIFPVNYVYDGNVIAFRTDPGTKLEGVGRAPACFEVDAFDRDTRQGWSVVVHGRLEEIDHYRGAEFDRLRALGIDPWADGDKSHYVRLVPTSITGRRVTEE
jgi:nitroimidazol reductase NimA-like FMN-containing flavoprotein (pyridoxamine 5'-phosphate oxidase superfamily)